jgi:hypothetical protein
MIRLFPIVFLVIGAGVGWAWFHGSSGTSASARPATQRRRRWNNLATMRRDMRVRETVITGSLVFCTIDYTINLEHRRGYGDEEQRCLSMRSFSPSG